MSRDPLVLCFLRSPEEWGGALVARAASTSKEPAPLGFFEYAVLHESIARAVGVNDARPIQSAVRSWKADSRGSGLVSVETVVRSVASIAARVAAIARLDARSATVGLVRSIVRYEPEDGRLSPRIRPASAIRPGEVYEPPGGGGARTVVVPHRCVHPSVARVLASHGIRVVASMQRGASS